MGRARRPGRERGAGEPLRARERCAPTALLRKALTERHPDVHLVGLGPAPWSSSRRSAGPTRSSARFRLAGCRARTRIGHTRMATESAVTTDGAHPSRPASTSAWCTTARCRTTTAAPELVARGPAFQTENDSEVAAGYLTWRMRDGRPLEQALEASLADLDGFYTFVVGTERGFGVLRDPIACKPAVWPRPTLGRLRHRVPRAGRPARHRGRARLGTGTGDGLRLGRGLDAAIDRPGESRCASSTPRCTGCRADTNQTHWRVRQSARRARARRRARRAGRRRDRRSMSATTAPA